MKIIKALVIGLSIFYCSMTFAQSRDVSVKLKHGLPNILKVTNVRVYSDSPTSVKISIWVNVQKGKIVSIALIFLLVIQRRNNLIHNSVFLCFL